MSDIMDRDTPQSASQSPVTPSRHSSSLSTSHDRATRPTSPSSGSMSIHSLLAASKHVPAQPAQPAATWSSSSATPGPSAERIAASQPASAKRKHQDSSAPESSNKVRRTTYDSKDPAEAGPSNGVESNRTLTMTTVVCLHAAVAQKSYGSEKRFLCPPPLVRIEGYTDQLKHQQLSMCIVTEGGDRSPDQRSAFDDSLTANFKFLHVGGTSKTKTFQLTLDIADPLTTDGSTSANGPPRVWASFDSAPVSIISKPSKKTAKTRNISSCILAGGPASLFNRINSQTVRTKYMAIDNGNLCASNNSWAAFMVNVIRRPTVAPFHVGGAEPVLYGCEVVLTDQHSGISTGPLTIRKVDKGIIAMDDGGPVSQMQKIALQRINQDGSRSYLSAVGPPPAAAYSQGESPTAGSSSSGSSHALLFQSCRSREQTIDGTRMMVDEVDDFICWTIVGISKFQYTFFDAYGSQGTPPQPITPFPTLFTPPVYRPTTNTMELTVSNFFYDDPATNSPKPLEVWLGNIGPLRQRIYQSIPSPTLNMFAPLTIVTQKHDPNDDSGPLINYRPLHSRTYEQDKVVYSAGPVHTIVIVEMPSVNEIIQSIHETVPPTDGDGEPEQARASSSHPSGQRSSDAPGPADSVGPASRSGKLPASDVELLARGLPLFFIRASDGTGYHSGRSVACENFFQTVSVGNAEGGPVANLDPTWVAAAQAATAEGGLHGWTLKVV